MLKNNNDPSASGFKDVEGNGISHPVNRQDIQNPSKGQQVCHCLAMENYQFNKSEQSWVRVECEMEFQKRWFAMADTAQECRSKSCLGDYVRGAALVLATDVAIYFAEKYTNNTLDDVCVYLRAQGFFKSQDGQSEEQAELEFRKMILG